MTFVEAFAKLCELAPGYCSLEVKVTRGLYGEIKVDWSTYDNSRDPGWSERFCTADQALDDYIARVKKQPPIVDGIDPIPASTK